MLEQNIDPDCLVLGNDRDEDIIAQAKKEVSYHHLVLPPYSGPGLKDVADAKIRKVLEDEIVFPLKNKGLLADYGLKMPNGALFLGPPGCGKTYMAESVAEECGMSFADVKPADLANTYVTGQQLKVAALFAEARLKAPALIFIDEVESQAPNRGSPCDYSAIKNDLVGQLLTDLNGYGEKGVYVILATNLPNFIDSALTRAGRIDTRIYVGPPCRDTRLSIFKSEMMKCKLKRTLNYEKLADLTDGLVTSDIVDISRNAILIAARNRTYVTEKIIEGVASGYKPSVTINEIRKYEEARRQFEGADTVRRIGFKI
jgi:transitional endoplasmic reticulum ATPase